MQSTKQILALLAIATVSTAAPHPAAEGAITINAAPSINCTSLEPSALRASSVFEQIRAGTSGATHEQLGYIIQSYWDSYGAMLWACNEVLQVASVNVTQA